MQNDDDTKRSTINEELASLFKMLGHPQRLAILRLLETQELCVCDIEAALDLRQAYISQQLTLLREAGLVCFRREGWNVRYRIARPEVYTLLEMAETIHGTLGECAWVKPEEAATVSCGVSCQEESLA
ncbi:MAG TPA: metalloregulator ArsR/SmtB family transcription factor [Anaerolineae bacterium]|nr:metalloregulator ArsR/SmtB family transcription factor [Anaerolineae bacterium]HQK13732.1 metalloregulator ArsR/SmtB family transcription factor [Anaerolineae bacterium]